MWFSILDARSGYWDLKIDDASADLTTFNSPHGRFRFNRMPMGISCAQDEFQWAIDCTFQDIHNVFGIADDLIVVGFSEDGHDHDQTLHAVLQCARENGPRLNPDKLKVRAREIPFFGHIIEKDGVRPDPAKIAAINDMKPPKNTKELMSFLGLVNYLHRFSGKLASLTTPLCALLKKDAELSWSPSHEKAFDAIKTKISATTALRYYDPKKELVVQVDASGTGLGAALMQEGAPIAFASKSLTDAESRYSTIESEMLGVLYGLEHFHYYVNGQHVNVHTDHKPLQAITSKNLANAPPRLAHILLRTQKYNFTVKYHPAAEVPIADALSRVSPSSQDTLSDVDIDVHQLDTLLCASPTCLQEIRHATAQDTTLNALTDMVSRGWPYQQKDCPDHLAPFWNYRNEIGIQDGLLLKGDRIIVPSCMQPQVLHQLHVAHQGIEKTKLLACTAVFWVNMPKDIENMITNCPTCQKYQPAQQREPLHNHEVPPHAWHTIAVDLFSWEWKTYLHAGDIFSRFPIVRKLTTLSSQATINILRSIFDEYRIPIKLLSDNGPQFASKEFHDFSQAYGFEHTTTSPHFLKSTWFIEHLVRTSKCIFTKCHETALDPHLALLSYCATPISAHLPSPTELLSGRKFKTILTCHQVPTHNNTRETLLQMKQSSAENHNQHAKSLPPLNTGQNFRIRNPITHVWERATVASKAPHPRSYIVKTPTGHLHCNRQDICIVPPQSPPITPPNGTPASVNVTTPPGNI